MQYTQLPWLSIFFLEVSPKATVLSLLVPWAEWQEAVAQVPSVHHVPEAGSILLPVAPGSQVDWTLCQKTGPYTAGSGQVLPRAGPDALI